MPDTPEKSSVPYTQRPRKTFRRTIEYPQSGCMCYTNFIYGQFRFGRNRKCSISKQLVIVRLYTIQFNVSKCLSFYTLALYPPAILKV